MEGLTEHGGGGVRHVDDGCHRRLSSPASWTTKYHIPPTRTYTHSLVPRDAFATSNQLDSVQVLFESENASPESGGAALIHLQTHPVVDLVVRKCDVVLVDRVPAKHPSACQCAGDAAEEKDVPLLELDLCMVRPRLSSDELLEVADRVVWAALHADCKNV